MKPFKWRLTFRTMGSWFCNTFIFGKSQYDYIDKASYQQAEQSYKYVQEQTYTNQDFST